MGDWNEPGFPADEIDDIDRRSITSIDDQVPAVRTERGEGASSPKPFGAIDWIVRNGRCRWCHRGDIIYRVDEAIRSDDVGGMGIAGNLDIGGFTTREGTQDRAERILGNIGNGVLLDPRKEWHEKHRVIFCKGRRAAL